MCHLLCSSLILCVSLMHGGFWTVCRNKSNRLYKINMDGLKLPFLFGYIDNFAVAWYIVLKFPMFCVPWSRSESEILRFRRIFTLYAYIFWRLNFSLRPSLACISPETCKNAQKTARKNQQKMPQVEEFASPYWPTVRRNP